MDSTLAERVRERLEALGINPFEAARRAGFERSFVNDLLIGRKKSVRGASLLKLAAALGCDPAYLVGMQAAARHTPEGGAAWPGAVEACAAAQICAATPPDPRHDVAAQRAFCVLDDHAEEAGIRRGSCLVAYRPAPGDGLSDGDLAVVRRSHEEGGAETAIWRLSVTLDGLRLIPPGGGDSVPLRTGTEADAEGVELLGIVSMAVRLF